MRTFVYSLLFSFSVMCAAHEGHHHDHDSHQAIEHVHEVESDDDFPGTWLQWVGKLHLCLIHFPIALINVLVVAECLYAWLKRPIFDYSARFLLIAAATLAIPTTILGLIYSYSGIYTGIMETFLYWHMWLGIATTTVTILLAFLREIRGTTVLYYALLACIFVMINITSFLGGEMTFGPYHLAFPI